MENIGIGAGLAALGFWLFVAAASIAGIWDGIRKREAQHETLRRVIESGQAVDSELTDKLLGGDRKVGRDLKIAGLITLGTAPGFALLGLCLSLIAPPALMALLGVAALAGCAGIGLLAASRVAERSDRETARTTPRSAAA